MELVGYRRKGLIESRIGDKYGIKVNIYLNTKI
jgi:hypothetical protein